MKLSKFALISGTALTLSMSAAFADNNNEAYLDQTGNGGHSASIDQSGGSYNQAGSATLNVTQQNRSAGNPPNGNTLTIEQSGSYNAVGLVTVPGRNSGFFQLQQGLDSRNSATVTQSSDSNTIGWISQVAGFGSTTGNTLTSTQKGGDGNIINSISQDRTDNGDGHVAHTASITQNGTDNFIDRVLQTGSGNDATLAIEGDNNGGGALTGLAIVGAENSSAIQQGTSNQLGFAITGGSDNQFGFRQNGTGNEALGLAILGNFNELGVDQSGTTNTVSLATINGNDNVIGFMQNGTSNVASATVAGSGNNNEFGIAQTGTTNDATVNITGSDNGARSTFGLFGVAASVGGTNGLVEQYGMSNIALLNITGDNNAFALAQGSAVADGDNNSITGTVNGNNNAAAVSQSGSNNIAVFAQTGNGNSAGIIQ